jgi:catechol 2,3-dioxygenase-like lactoylglutathione lyase family enzyme
MRDIVERMVRGYEEGAVSRRDLILALTGLAVGGAGQAAAQADRGALAPEGINHVTLFVSDMDRSVEFYQKLFEMPIQSRQQGGTNLSAGSGTQFLGIFQIPGRTPRIDHVCLAVRDFDVDRVMATLRENGVEGRVRMRGEVPEIYFNDPDGISIQLQDARYCGGGGALGDQC